MALHPGAQWVLDSIKQSAANGRPPLGIGSPELARDNFRRGREALVPDAPDMGLIEDATLPGKGGKIPFRYYRPKCAPENALLPVVLFFHGGGWVLGNVESHDVVCRTLCNSGSFAVISIDYRLAPENKFPAALDDAEAALCWIAAGAGGRQIDCDRIAVCGDSAGGNLSTVLTLLTRDMNGPKISFQGLFYPVTDFHRRSHSHEKFSEGYFLTSLALEWFFKHYLNHESEKDDWRVSPASHHDHSHLPPAHIITADCDPLRDEGIAYAQSLRAAGVSATYNNYFGVIHGFISMGRVIDQAELAIVEMSKSINTAWC